MPGSAATGEAQRSPLHGRGAQAFRLERGLHRHQSVGRHAYRARRRRRSPHRRPWNYRGRRSAACRDPGARRGRRAGARRHRLRHAGALRPSRPHPALRGSAGRGRRRPRGRRRQRPGSARVGPGLRDAAPVRRRCGRGDARLAGRGSHGRLPHSFVEETRSCDSEACAFPRRHDRRAGRRPGDDHWTHLAPAGAADARAGRRDPGRRQHGGDRRPLADGAAARAASRDRRCAW